MIPLAFTRHLHIGQLVAKLRLSCACIQFNTQRKWNLSYGCMPSSIHDNLRGMELDKCCINRCLHSILDSLVGWLFELMLGSVHYLMLDSVFNLILDSEVVTIHHPMLDLALELMLGFVTLGLKSHPTLRNCMVNTTFVLPWIVEYYFAASNLVSLVIEIGLLLYDKFLSTCNLVAHSGNDVLDAKIDAESEPNDNAYQLWNEKEQNIIILCKWTFLQKKKKTK